MAKKRTLNEIRQEKNYGYTAPSKTMDKEIVDSNLDIEAVKSMIVDKITKHFHDIMFEMINEAMMDYRIFQSQTYLTEEGYELFEDEYFEFYHKHHGDILGRLMRNITN
jgi:hypothetical protein